MENDAEIRIPTGWTELARGGLVQAIALARVALVQVLSSFENGRAPKARLLSQIERLKARVAQLETELEIKDRRMTRLPAARRPHYSPVDRLQILLLQAAAGWTFAETARRFLVGAQTLAEWKKRLDEHGPAALLQTVHPINRFPDQVRQLVRDLKRMIPSMGRQRIADSLARTGLVLAASTVRRMTLEPLTEPTHPVSEPPGDGCSDISHAENDRGRHHGIDARYKDHVWHCDLTVVPTALGLWVPWFPMSVFLGWPFAYWVAGVIDQYSRAPIKLKAFTGQPSSRDVQRFLRSAIKLSGRAPKHLITDRGAQFQTGYRSWCARLGVRPRWGAVGSHKSIAIIERFWRSMKHECCRRILVPLKPAAMQAELDCYAAWFRQHRPHQGLGGLTPEDRRAEKLAVVVRLEPRPRMPIRGDPSASRRVSTVQLRVTQFAGRDHLPVLEVDAA